MLKRMRATDTNMHMVTWVPSTLKRKRERESSMQTCTWCDRSVEHVEKAEHIEKEERELYANVHMV